VKISNPLYPTAEIQQLLHNRRKESSLLRGAVVTVDTDLILDILVMYTNEALADYSGRFKINFFSSIA
jgi:hypothetical protein